MLRKRAKDPTTDREQIRIAQRLIALRQAGKLAGAWIDSGVTIRVAMRTVDAGPAIKRLSSWVAADVFAAEIEGEGPAGRGAISATARFHPRALEGGRNTHKSGSRDLRDSDSSTSGGRRLQMERIAPRLQP